jgi:hypothetical protein
VGIGCYSTKARKKTSGPPPLCLFAFLKNRQPPKNLWASPSLFVCISQKSSTAKKTSGPPPLCLFAFLKNRQPATDMRPIVHCHIRPGLAIPNLKHPYDFATIHSTALGGPVARQRLGRPSSPSIVTPSLEGLALSGSRLVHLKPADASSHSVHNSPVVLVDSKLSPGPAGPLAERGTCASTWHDPRGARCIKAPGPPMARPGARARGL